MYSLYSLSSNTTTYHDEEVFVAYLKYPLKGPPTLIHKHVKGVVGEQ